VDKALVLFQFEEEFLASRGINAEFVGHPLMDMPTPLENNSAKFTIGLLPGSRKSEVMQLLPTILSGAQLIAKSKPEVRFMLAESSNIDKALYDSILEDFSDLDIKRINNNSSLVLKESDFVVVASGTATLETSVMEKPMVVVYRLTPISCFMARRLMKVQFVGLVNIIAKREIVPELLQDDLTAENLSQKTLSIINNPSRIEEIKKDLLGVKKTLGEKGASLRAAKAVKNFSSSLSS